jgi:hypothetical protein
MGGDEDPGAVTGRATVTETQALPVTGCEHEPVAG